MSQKKRQENKDLKTISKTLQESLPEVKWSPTPLLDLEILIAHVIQKDRIFVSANPQYQLSQQELDLFKRLVKRREKQEPIAYVIGQKHFYNYDFHVDSTVLIPRPETELLVEEALKYVENHNVKSIADIGTGSGCIIITIAKELQKKDLENTVRFTATDISKEALGIAQQNHKTHFPKGGVEIKFEESDLLENVSGEFDVILSNLPYIPQKEYEKLEKNVVGFEPQLALIGGEEGSELIEELLAQAAQKVNTKSLILLEINHDQGKAILKIAKKHFPENKIDIIKDYANFDRILKVERFEPAK